MQKCILCNRCNTFLITNSSLASLCGYNEYHQAISSQSGLYSNYFIFFTAVFQLPQLLPDTTTYLQHNQADPLHVMFTIHGVADYVRPATTILNSQNIEISFNSTRHNITINRLSSQKKTMVTFNADGGALLPSNYTFRVCIELNSYVSSSYAERYNHNPNCTTKHINIYKGQQECTITLRGILFTS